MRVVFMATGAFAIPSLEALAEAGHEVAAVVTQPDRAKGRGQTLAPPPVKPVAERLGLSVLQVRRVREPETQDLLRGLRPQLQVVVAFGQILPRSVIDIPPLGTLNVHASLLPKYRGAAPIQWAIAGGETETGVTTMLIDEGLDTGPTLLSRTLAIGAEETAAELEPRLARLGAELLLESVRGLAAGQLTPQAQDQARATLAPVLKKDDGRIEWTRHAQQIACRVRGFTPWPGAFTQAGGRLLKILRASALPEPAPAGGAGSGPGRLVFRRHGRLRRRQRPAAGRGAAREPKADGGGGLGRRSAPPGRRADRLILGCPVAPAGAARVAGGLAGAWHPGGRPRRSRAGPSRRPGPRAAARARARHAAAPRLARPRALRPRLATAGGARSRRPRGAASRGLPAPLHPRPRPRGALGVRRPGARGRATRRRLHERDPAPPATRGSSGRGRPRFGPARAGSRPRARYRAGSPSAGSPAWVPSGPSPAPARSWRCRRPTFASIPVWQTCPPGSPPSASAPSRPSCRAPSSSWRDASQTSSPRASSTSRTRVPRWSRSSPRPTGRVLDACAAPGGKSLLLADLAGVRLVIAAEASLRRMRTLEKLRARWGASRVLVLAADARRPPFRAPFDGVLLDAPCSGLGTLARHPDIRWRLRASDLLRHAERQRVLLESVAALVRPGGRLVYATCSVEPEENEDVVRPFLARHHGLRPGGPAALGRAAARRRLRPHGAGRHHRRRVLRRRAATGAWRPERSDVVTSLANSRPPP